MTTSFKSKVSLTLPIIPESEGGGLQIWATSDNMEGTENVLSKVEFKYQKFSSKGQQYGKLATVQLRDITIKQLKDLLKSLSKI